MSAWQLIGAALIALPFLGFLWVMFRNIGLREIALTLGGCLVLIVPIIVGSMLLHGDLP